MDSTTYNVIVRLSMQGSLMAAMGNIEGSASRVGMLFNRVADSALRTGVHLAAWGGAAAIGAAVYGVGKLNTELENTEVALAAIANAQGYTKTFGEGMSLARHEIEVMKRDVEKLPGNLNELANIMTTIATPAAQARMTFEQIEKFAGRTMLMASILNVPQNVAAREMAQLLSGHATAQNLMAQRLGFMGQAGREFNQLSPEARASRLSAEMDKYSAAAERVSHTFTTQWTTLRKNVEFVLLAPVTAPLFEHVKVTLEQMNAWFEKNQDRIKETVETVGEKLASAWDKATEAAKKAWPIIEKIVDKIEHLSKRDIVQGAEDAGKVYLGMKFAGAALPLVGRLAGAGAEAAGGALGVGGSVVAGGALAAGAVGIGGAVDILTNSTSMFHESATWLSQDIKSGMAQAWSQMKSIAEPIIEFARAGMDVVGFGFLVALKTATDGLNLFLSPLAEGAAIFKALRLYGQGMPFMKLLPDAGLSVDHDPTLNLRSIGGYAEAYAQAQAAKQANAKGPKTHITVTNHIVIRVTNPDPSRVARLVAFEIKRQSMYPLASPYSPNQTGRP